MGLIWDVRERKVKVRFKISLLICKWKEVVMNGHREDCAYSRFTEKIRSSANIQV